MNLLLRTVCNAICLSLSYQRFYLVRFFFNWLIRDALIKMTQTHRQEYYKYNVKTGNFRSESTVCSCNRSFRSRVLNQLYMDPLWCVNKGLIVVWSGPNESKLLLI